MHIYLFRVSFYLINILSFIHKIITRFESTQKDASEKFLGYGFREKKVMLIKKYI